ncbi:hypothetical protein V2A60_006485 [Cordyceps javanica]
MKKLLALHGVGSSSDILRVQLNPVVKALESEYEFIFFDGAFTRERGPGMASHYPGPFYSYTTGYAPGEIRVALDDLDDMVQDCGPFAGVIGFSQGASMAASYILDHQRRCPGEPAPFGFAVLLSSVAGFSPDTQHCLPIVQHLLREKHDTLSDFPDHVSAKLPRLEQVFVDYLAATFNIARKIGATGPDYDVAFFRHRHADKVPRLLHPVLTEARIGIPTVHYTGERDHSAMVEQSLVVMGMCERSMARGFQHSGGHAVPTKPDEVKRLVRDIEWAAAESNSQQAMHKALNVKPRSMF